jgi:hypothetical protein
VAGKQVAVRPYVMHGQQVAAERLACGKQCGGISTIAPLVFSGHRLIPGEMQQPVAGRANERVPVRAVLAVQREQDPALVSIVLLPPSIVGDRLVGVLVGQVINVVIGNLDRESILFRAHR